MITKEGNSTYFCPKCGENVPEYHECSDGSTPALTHPEGWQSDGTLAGGKRRI